MKLPSKFQIDDPVMIETEVNTIKGEIAGVRFTTGDIQYDVDINPGGNPCIIYDVRQEYVFDPSEFISIKNSK